MKKRKKTRKNEKYINIKENKRKKVGKGKRKKKVLCYDFE